MPGLFVYPFDIKDRDCDDFFPDDVCANFYQLTTTNS